MKSTAVLIVDRDEMMVDILRDALSWVDIVSYGATDIKGALEVLEHHPIDLIISEYRLNFGTGIELLERAEGCGLKTPLALMVSSDLDISMDVAFAKGVQMIFMKPFPLEDFIEGAKVLLKLKEESESIAHSLPQTRLLSL